MDSIKEKNYDARAKSPWWWVPTLYFAEGVPYFVVNTISVMMFTKMGVPNGDMSFFTTLLYFPWFLKGIWSPIVDVIKTKRWWIVTMQAMMALLMVLLTVSLPHPAQETIASGQTPISMFTFTLVLFIITAFASATHDIAADGFYMLVHSPGSQAAFIGIRSTFYRVASVFVQGILVFIAGMLEKSTGNIPLSWQVTLGCAAVVFGLITLYHTFCLPRSGADKARTPADHAQAGAPRESKAAELANSFITFVKKPNVLLAIAFMLLYRLPEGFLIKMCQPFLVHSTANGGLGLDTDTVGIVYGTIGVIALLTGGIAGGVYASRRGLKRSLWLMAACMTLPCLTFVYLAIAQPASITLISIAVSIEQFGYGFGFTAYMLYMMYFSEGEFKTSHYAICTAFMALSMMLPGFVAGYIEEAIGYVNFFWMVMACCLATLAVTYFVDRKIDPEYGKK
ncbi:MFS transporter [Bacteroides helcogenes]|uniref:Transmembrane permease n=1 Tax=Bacteroides helcogenes (strain ATCC 35417 / DSM 20613 / JCM 6297 / CCUG 15421 / P 36-108) TaxID=693979 RepID=E6SUY8_BACT6|nr:MFS transporter [Bacteroides helcogenes]ADV42424.1 putative transmembrane permease [Bacteroides helcogenes P 36-108]MDY5238073.1 MFS transporter [Bacteroides helcogenes]